MGKNHLRYLEEPEAAAEAAGLRYYSDEQPGYSRKKWGRGFRYSNEKGEPLEDEQALQRIEELVIPPAWEQVWISPYGNGHLQATGYDEAGRKQYLYHAKWQEVRNLLKFYRLIRFAQALPKIREVTEQHLRKQKLSREKVLALVVKLLEYTRARIGNAQYAQRNNSYGLSTLRDKHVKETGSRKLRLEFEGKRGKAHEIELEDPRLARLVKECKDVPGYELFQYYDDEGQKHPIDSGDVNEYIRDISGSDFTAKDFRTWGGTVFALEGFCERGLCEDDKELKKQTVEVVKEVAGKLRNTTAISRQYYIHPEVIKAFETGEIFEIWKKARADRKDNGRSRSENAVRMLLEQKVEELEL